MSGHNEQNQEETKVFAVSRREFLSVCGGAVSALLLASCGAPPASPTPAAVIPTVSAVISPKKGGILKIAITSEPPAVADAMFTTAQLTGNIGMHIFEGLFTRDSKFGPKPILAESYTAAPDGKLFEFKLREGIKFHNGQKLTSKDVAASLTRWQLLTNGGKQLASRLDKMETPDTLTVRLVLKEPFGLLLDFLALPNAFVLPADIAAAAGKNQLKENQMIGTAPFKLAEHVTDRFIRLTRYDDYVSRSDAADGAAGKRAAFLDELQFIPVPDSSVRTNGMITGEYHYCETLAPDDYKIISDEKNLDPIIVKPNYWYPLHLNKKRGPFTNENLRKAVSYLVPCEEALKAGWGVMDFVRADSSLAARETVWYSTAGAEFYNKVDPAKAKSLIAEAGYKGEVLRWITTKEFPYHYNIAEYVKSKLEAAGMKVELVVSDWATVTKNRADAEQWEIFVTGHPSYSHPATAVFLDGTWPGWWVDAEKDALVKKLTSEPDLAKQKPLIDNLHTMLYNKMPIVRIGENFMLRGIRKNVLGYQNIPDYFFWNVSLA